MKQFFMVLLKSKVNQSKLKPNWLIKEDNFLIDLWKNG